MIGIHKLLPWFGCFILVPNLFFAEECKPLTEATKISILSDLSRRWKLGNTAGLKLKDEAFFRDTCYRSLILEGGSLEHPWTIFLSPDQRFVMGSLIDTALSPEQDAKKESLRIHKLLLADESPQSGSSNAQITIVEFGDFQCPYCKQFDQWMKGLRIDDRKYVNLVYKHLPLRKHAWARDAAMATACAGSQSVPTFWLMHDFIFREQEHLTLTNIHDEVANFAATIPELNIKQLAECMDTRGGEQIVNRDEMLAGRLLVRNTPTIFINGEKVTEWPPWAEIQRRIAQVRGQTNARP
jgi:protein-disulfide isomerase